MPVVKTPSSSLPASPRVGNYRPVDIDRVFQNLSNNGSSSLHHQTLQPTPQQQQNLMAKPNNNGITSELAQLHLLGSELRSGLMKAASVLQQVQNNDETMRANIEAANVQTQRGLNELAKVVASVQNDSNQVKIQCKRLENSNSELQRKMTELEKLCRQFTVEPVTLDTVALTTPDATPPSVPSVQDLNKEQLSLYHISAGKFRQSVSNFLSTENQFCQRVSKLCQQHQSQQQQQQPHSQSSPPSENFQNPIPTALWQVYRLHSEFLAQAEGRMAKWGHWGCVGDLFLRLFDNKQSHFADIYKLYANELLSIFGPGGSPVSPPLLLPFRRLADYIAFLEATRAGLDSDHPDLYNIMKASEKLRLIINRLNEQQLRFLLVAEKEAPIGHGTGNFAERKCKKDFNEGSATLSRPRYTQNKNSSRGSEFRKQTSRSNLMLKSRSHGDLYIGSHNNEDFDLEPDISDLEDMEEDIDYSGLYDTELATRSLPRARINQMKRQRHHRTSSDDSDGVLDCWTSKQHDAATSSLTASYAQSAMSRPCSTAVDLHSVPPTPIRSCDTALRHGRNRQIFVPSNNGTISSGSSGSGGSTSGKSTYQPLESMKQSLLNLFNGYKKKKRATLRENGMMSNHNAPQIRILSPPSTIVGLNSQQNQLNVMNNSNLHVDVRSEQCRSFTASTNSDVGSNNLPSPPTSPSPMLSHKKTAATVCS